MQKTDQINEKTLPKGNKHDDFFRNACAKPFIVEPLIRYFVEPELSQKMDYSKLELCHDSYITPELANYYSDRLWSIGFKNRQEMLHLLLLFEHKSFIPKRIHIQLLRYMIEDWTKQIEAQLEAMKELQKKGKKNQEKIKLILILPIVLYHGKQAWKKPEFEDLFGKIPELLKRFLPDFDFIVIDLSQYSDQEIMDTEAGLLVNMLLLLRHSFDTEYLVNNFDLIMSGIENYDRDSDYWQFAHSILVYFCKLLKNNPMEKAAVMEKIQTKRAKKDFYSVYDAIVDEGELRGELRGKLEGRSEGEMKKARLVVLRGKWKGASADFLADQSELPLTEVENMLKSYDTIFQLWSNKKMVNAIPHLTEEEVTYLIALFGQK